MSRVNSAPLTNRWPAGAAGKISTLNWTPEVYNRHQKPTPGAHEVWWGE